MKKLIFLPLALLACRKTDVQRTASEMDVTVVFAQLHSNASLVFVKESNHDSTFFDNLKSDTLVASMIPGFYTIILKQDSLVGCLAANGSQLETYNVHLKGVTSDTQTYVQLSERYWVHNNCNDSLSKINKK